MIRSENILPRDDRQAANFLRKQMEKDGCKFFTKSTITSLHLASNEARVQMVEGVGFKVKTSPEILIKYKQQSTEGVTEDKEIQVDGLLFSMGRVPNVENMGLEAAGV